MIQRSDKGRFLLFDKQFMTLYDLVYYHQNNDTALGCGLTGSPQLCHMAPLSTMDPPSKPPKRDVFSMPMQIEQLAAKNFEQVR